MKVNTVKKTCQREECYSDVWHIGGQVFWESKKKTHLEDSIIDKHVVDNLISPRNAGSVRTYGAPRAPSVSVHTKNPQTENL